MVAAPRQYLFRKLRPERLFDFRRSAVSRRGSSKTRSEGCRPRLNGACREHSAARHLVASTRRLPTPPFHDPVEGFEIGPGLTLLKERRCLKRRNLFRHGRGDELVYAGSFFLTDP